MILLLFCFGIERITQFLPQAVPVGTSQTMCFWQTSFFYGLKISRFNHVCAQLSMFYVVKIMVQYHSLYFVVELYKWVSSFEINGEIYFQMHLGESQIKGLPK